LPSRPTYKNTIFGNTGDTLEERMRAYDERIAQNKINQQIEKQSTKVMEKLHHLHKKSFEDIISVHGNDPPNQTQITAFYTSIEKLFNSLNIPIVQYEHLSLTSSTFPVEEALDNKVKARVSSLLFTKLNSAVPKSWHKIRTIIEPYTTSQDGYGALFSIMTNNSGYLRIFRSLWGPLWTTEMNPYQYLLNLQHYLNKQRNTIKSTLPLRLPPKSFNKPTNTNNTKSSLPPTCQLYRVLTPTEPFPQSLMNND
jgi:hypothetical protein